MAKKNTQATTNTNTKENTTMERANRITVETTEYGYVAHFYRTHKHIGDIEIPTDNAEHNNSLREGAREVAIDMCSKYGIEWKPELQAQAWDRKHNIYMTEEEITEDTITLVTPAIERLVGKCKYDTKLIDISVCYVAPKKSNLSYVEEGRYTKSGAWCCADIEVVVTVQSSYFEDSLQIHYNIELKSGQICKPKTTIAEWDMMTFEEITLSGIVLPTEEEVA